MRKQKCKQGMWHATILVCAKSFFKKGSRVQLLYSAYWSVRENHHFSFLMGGDFHMWSRILLALPSLRKMMDFL